MSDKEQIEKMLQQQFPGFQIKWAEDQSLAELPAPVAEMMAKLELMQAKSLQEGSCIDCGTKMPNYQAIQTDDNWKPAEDWRWFKKGEEIVCWQCPDCDKKEE